MMSHSAIAQGWAACMRQVAAHLAACKADPARSVVLLPYAQLLPVARQQWLQLHPVGLLPRFETTSNWAQQVQPFVAGPDDMAFDPAQDWLIAHRLLQQAGFARQAFWLAARVREAALQLAPVAAAKLPDARMAWVQQVLPALRSSMEAQALQLETAVASVALAWAGHSAFATDALFPLVQQGQLDALVVLHGLHVDALAQCLLECQQKIHPGTELALRLDFTALREAERDAVQCPAEQSAGSHHAPRDAQVQVHVADNMEDQALRAAACVQRAVVRQQGLVALVDTDRAQTRRIRALLEGQGVTIRDETGWKLSTTLAASHVMALLRACTPQAGSDAVLGWLKLAQAVGAANGQEQEHEPQAAVSPVPAAHVQAVEGWLRWQMRAQWPSMHEWQAWPHPAAAWVQQVEHWRQSMQARRSLAQWLADLVQVLQASGQWHWLAADAAGQAVLQALHLDGGTHMHASSMPEGWTLADCTGWVNDVLEAGSFKPPYPLREQVVVAPLRQLLARDFAAVVLPGCDALRLPGAPELPGNWTAVQRALLGLPGREEAQAQARAAWQHAVAYPHVDMLTSHSDTGGELLQHSPLLLEWIWTQTQTSGGGVPDGDATRPDSAVHPLASSDPRSLRTLDAQPQHMPQPCGATLPFQKLSASAYDSLRTCPYQFFSRQLLQLYEVQELSGTLEKRDFGNWLHATLRLFHEAWAMQGNVFASAQRPAIAAALDAAANQAAQAQRLDAAAFLPFATAWPKLREGYVDWLLGEYAALNATFCEGEAERGMALAKALQQVAGTADCDLAADLSDVQLTGKLDRIDTLLPPATSDALAIAPAWLLLDYKTESAQKTQKRISNSHEDTQLPFYAALFAPQTVRVGYVNVGENGCTTFHEQANVAELRDQLLAGMAADVRQIRSGAPLPALGRGAACDWCNARGLCRKDFWEDAA